MALWLEHVSESDEQLARSLQTTEDQGESSRTGEEDKIRRRERKHRIESCWIDRHDNM